MPLGSDTGGAPLYRCNNCSSAPIKLPFSFCFYGKSYDTVYINNKGSLSFIHPDFTFSSEGLPAGVDTLMLAAFWADINDRAAPVSHIYYKITPTHMIVQWSNAGYSTFDNDLYDDIQITITNGSDSILTPGNNVSYCYWLMRWASADSSGGSGGFGGLPAVVGVNKGDNIHYAQFGTFNLPGYTYYGPFDTTNELYSLNNNSFIFNTCVTGNNIPPVIENPDLCDTVTMCAGDTFSFPTKFICPQRGQKATLIASSPGLSGLTSDTSSAHSTYTISTKLIAVLKDTGTHLINITATDNSSPPLTNNFPFTVFIKNCNDTTTGIHEISEFNSANIYPNPNTGKFTIQSASVKGRSIVEINNLLGEKVYSRTIPNGTQFFNIDMSSQVKGIYFIKLYNENTLIDVKKVVIQ